MSNKVIADGSRPDPWMVAANDVFYLTFTLGNRIELWESSSMDDFFNPRKCLVWRPQSGSPWSADIWAPELHQLNGIWYIYATASNPGVGNHGHRTIVLRSGNQDPMMESAWEFLGPLKGLPDHFSIDATVFSPNKRDLYICWSGWPPHDSSDYQQNLYLTKMVSPEEAVDSSKLKPVCISCADHDWERFNSGTRGINEGPTWVSLPDGTFSGIVYSGHASFTSEYKLGLLRLSSPDANPMNQKSWTKRPTPLLFNDQSNPGPYAPGHASFVLSPHQGDNRVFCIFHATDKWGEGFSNRKARIMALEPKAFAPNAQPVCCSSAPSNPSWKGASRDGHQNKAAKAKMKVQKYTNKVPEPVRKAVGSVINIPMLIGIVGRFL
ncbi:hypothetical protein ACO1O0_004833 [Amphichorda felina]